VANVKTRFGFEGDETGGGAEPEPARGAKTIFGRQVHRPDLKTLEVEPPSLSGPVPSVSRATPTPAVAPPRNAEPRAATRKTPAPTRASALGHRKRTPQPSVARFMGRRNTAGNFVPLTETDILLLPRPPWMKPVFTVAGAALCSFVVVAIIIWLLGPTDRARPTVSPAAAKTRVTSPPPAPVVAAPRAAFVGTPTAAPLAGELEAMAEAETTPPTRSFTRARAAGSRAAPPRKIRQLRRLKRGSPDPDAPLPPTFF
jgi:hypothetical protein